MDFNQLIDDFISDSSDLEMWVNNSTNNPTQLQYDCLAYLQGEFKNKMLSFKGDN